MKTMRAEAEAAKRNIHVITTWSCLHNKSLGFFSIVIIALACQLHGNSIGDLFYITMGPKTIFVISVFKQGTGSLRVSGQRHFKQSGYRVNVLTLTC